LNIVIGLNRKTVLFRPKN